MRFGRKIYNKKLQKCQEQLVGGEEEIDMINMKRVDSDIDQSKIYEGRRE